MVLMRGRIELIVAVLVASVAAAVSPTGGKDVQFGDGSTVAMENPKSSNYYSRRWDVLMEKCVGCWSGTIGWYDVEVKHRDNGEQGPYMYELNPRSDNNKRNMRLSFQTRAYDATTADWVVYHAKGQGVREEVVLQKKKKNSGDSPMQTFYSFDRGNLGRSGTNFMELPVIEHGFWDVSSDGGERRTVVLVYNPHDGHLMKVCYLQQKKKVGSLAKDFDVSGIERGDIGIMPTRPTRPLNYNRQNWLRSPESKYSEVLNVAKYQYKRKDPPRDEVHNTLLCLLGSKEHSNDNMLRVSLPNGVILACPLCVKSDDGTNVKSFNIAMGYQNRKGEVQVVEFEFERCKLKQVKGSTIEV
ncbi:hypothetical protein ACHAW6_007217 [Cyclotella cf. meneghiniana]